MMINTMRFTLDNNSDPPNFNKKSLLTFFGLPDSPILSIDDETEEEEEIVSTTESEVESEKPMEIFYETFFSQISHKFSVFNGVPFEQIQSELFLQTCEDYFSIIGKFNSPIFAPLKADVNGNINKIRRKISQNEMKFQTLYTIVNDEIDNQTTNARNSATDALLWLKRAFEFLSIMLFEFGQGDKTLHDAVSKAYEQSLRRYHGIFARHVFSFALRAVPAKLDFLRSLAVDPNDASNVLFQQQLFNEMIDHGSDLSAVLQKISSFYGKHELDSSMII